MDVCGSRCGCVCVGVGVGVKGVRKSIWESISTAKATKLISGTMWAVVDPVTLVGYLGQ